MEIRSLADTGFSTLFGAFRQAFADYEVQLDKAQLRRMLRRRGFDAGLSFAAFENGEIVSFTLNGIGSCGRVLTAYDTGTGTLKDYRGMGLAAKVFEESIPHLKQANVGQYLLEVLQHNDNAVSVYRKLGFETSREFNYYVCPKSAIRILTGMPATGYCLRPTDLQSCVAASDFMDFQPSWQNSFASIERSPEDFRSLGVFFEEQLVGYCIFEPGAGDITQLAVDSVHRRRGVGSLLLAEAIGQCKSDQLKIINTDIACDTMTRFLEAVDIPLSGRQFEMIRRI